MNRISLDELNNNTIVSFDERPGVDFVIRKEIGRGASCVVYHAVGSDNTEHLLKEYYPKYLELDRDSSGQIVVPKDKKYLFAKGLARFRTSCERQKNIRLSNEWLKNFTCNVQGYYVANGTEYIDMTCFNGQTYDHVQEKSVYNLMLRMRTLAKVIGNYHKAGLLHLDIKPENIYVHLENETIEDVMLFDFDSVTPMSEISTSKALSCTKTWAAPEQLLPEKRKSIGPWTDLFAIGEIIFVQLFGRHSTSAERRSFVSKYAYDHNAEIFKDMNPKVFPLLDDLLCHTICGVVGKRYQSTDELIAKLNELAELTIPKKPYLISKSITPNAFFIGRDLELNNIHEKLQENSKLFLSGIGGIGKSELAKNYAIRYKDGYDAILFATYNGSWMMLVNDDSRIQIANFERYEGEKEPEYCIRKLCKLNELCDNRTLFIIDNLDEDEFFDEEQKRWESILSLSCKFIFTTRIKDWNYPHITLGVLKQRQDLIDLYRNYCEISDGQQSVVNSIIDYVDEHTLTIELTAKLIATSELSPEIVLEKLNAYGIAKSGKEQVVMDKDNARRRQTPFDHICAIFDMTQLSDSQRYIMANMALIPLDGIELSQLVEWCELKDPDVVKHLVANGWLNQLENTIKMHPVVAGVALKFCVKSTPEHCQIMLKNQAKYLEAYNLKKSFDFEKTYQDVAFFNTLAENLLRFELQTDAVAEVLTAIPCLISGFGYINQAIKYQTYAFDFCQKKHGKHSSNTASALHNLGMLYVDLGDFEKALQYLKRSLRAKKKPLWFFKFDSWVSIATSINSLAIVQCLMGNYAKALQYAHKALFIQEKLLGDEDVETVASINNLGMIYREIGDFQEALRWEERALKLKNKIFGKENTSYTKSLSNISVLYADMGDVEQALLNMQKVLEIERKHLGENHTSVAITFSNLSALYYKMGEFEQAVQCSEKSLEIKIKLFGEDNIALSTPLCNLGTLYGKFGDFKRALQYTHQALEIEKKTYGEIHPKIVTSLNNIAGIYDNMGELEHALQTYKQALYMAQTLPETNLKLVSICLSNIGYLYEKTNELKVAEEYYAQAYEARRNILGDMHPDTERVKQRWQSVQHK